MQGWDKIRNTIAFTLKLAEDQRDVDVREFMQTIKQDYDRLFEVSPPLKHQFIKKLKQKLARAAEPGLRVPHYLNGFARFTPFHEP